MTKFSAFLKDESGAVTVDWVVLTAAVVPLAFIVFTYVRPSVSNLAQGIGTNLNDAQDCLLSTNSITC
jgi:Flp pilus assembly pilin Flp